MVTCEILEDGEKALFFKYDGNVALKEGPKRIWCFRSKLRRLQRYTAKHDQYLKITYKSGLIEHKLGPCHEFLNTLNHSSISIEQCYCMNPNEAIIIYKKTSKENEYGRRIECGPTIYLIQPDEWIHKFSWHGTTSENKTKYIAGQNSFEILNFAPDQLYYNVNRVRTADDALIRIKLMIFYELKDIDLMLNTTKDPIADMLNSCASDITRFTGTKTYLNFIENCSSLNDLDNYPKLLEHVNKIGFEVNKVVFRGYYASPKLQAMHDKSIEMHTKLKLEHESQLQENEKALLNLKNNIERLTNEQNLELQKLLNSQELEKIKNENKLNMKLDEVTSESEISKEKQIKEFKKIIDENNLKCDYLKNLKEYQVDPTEYMIHSLTVPEKVIKIDNTPNGKNNQTERLNIHFHSQ